MSGVSLLSNATPMCVYKMKINCRLHTGGVGLSFFDRLIFLDSALTRTCWSSGPQPVETARLC